MRAVILHPALGPQRRRLARTVVLLRVVRALADAPQTHSVTKGRLWAPITEHERWPGAPGAISTGCPGVVVTIPAEACCAPIAREPLSETDAADLATLLKAVADPVRLRLLSMIGSHPGVGVRLRSHRRLRP